MKTPDKPQEQTAEAASRREFLRTSIYAVYATPLITALLVEEAGAANSTPGCPPSKRKKCEDGELPPQACRHC